MAKKDKRELVIIGAGPGGYAAAFRAADLGLNVTLIDPEANPGGTCLYRGCIPSKALLHLFKVKEKAVAAAEWGFQFSEPEVDVKKVSEWKKRVVKELTAGIMQLAEQRKVEYLQGYASFTSEKELEVKNKEGETFTLAFDKAIIATGSMARELPEAPFDHASIIDSTDALQLDDIPANMLVIGGGYIGLELGSVYATLGCKVSLLESTSAFLSWVDQDLVNAFSKDNKGLFEEVFFNSRLQQVMAEGGKVQVSFKTEEGTQEKEYEKLLIAVGRKPHTADLQLEKAGVKVDEDGFIKVDKKRQTTAENIYAIGDVTNRPLFANKATHEGRLAAEAIAGTEGVLFDPKAIPSIVSTTTSEVSWCGLMETEAKEKGVEIAVASFPWTASGRAASIGTHNGLTKLILEPDSGRILGGGVAGKGAGALIAEIALSIEMAATAKDISLTLHPHPTLSETIMEAAEVFLGSATHLPEKKD